MKKGFTLIELLAVIVILAIIALIATPIVLDIIEDTKKSAQLRSAENYIKAAEMAVAKEMMYNASFKANKCNITSEGNLDCDGTSVEIKVSGEKPDGGELTFGSGSVTELTLVYNGDTTIIREGGELLFDDDNELDENATDASCFVTIVNYEYEIGPGCDAYVQRLYDEHLTCNIVEDNLGWMADILTYFLYSDSIEKLVEEDVVINLKDTNTISIQHYTCGGLEGNEKAIRNVVIPNKIKGKKVTKILPSAFRAHYNDNKEELIEGKLIESVVIPNNVTSIGVDAFDHNQLKSVEIPNSAIDIGGGAFANNLLTSVEIPNSVTSLGESAFANNQLKSVEIPNSVIDIGYGAFNYNELTSVVIKGKSSFDDFDNYSTAFGWAEGYSDANITWQP